jgi:hypothetical protein
VLRLIAPKTTKTSTAQNATNSTPTTPQPMRPHFRQPLLFCGGGAGGG